MGQYDPGVRVGEASTSKGAVETSLANFVGMADHDNGKTCLNDIRRSCERVRCGDAKVEGFDNGREICLSPFVSIPLEEYEK